MKGGMPPMRTRAGKSPIEFVLMRHTLAVVRAVVRVASTLSACFEQHVALVNVCWHVVLQSIRLRQRL